MINSVLKEKIDKRIDELVEEARKLVEGDRSGDSEIQKTTPSQIQNIINAAASLRSLKALTLFIRYQAARGYLPNVAPKLVKYINEDLTKIAEEITSKGSEEYQDVLFYLIQLFLGYLKRWFKINEAKDS